LIELEDGDDDAATMRLRSARTGRPRCPGLPTWGEVLHRQVVQLPQVGQESVRRMREATLQGRVAVVTGGANGIGAATVAELAASGAAVAIADLDESAGVEVARRVGALYVRTDVSSSAEVQHLMRSTAERFGGIDILVNNAGVVLAKSTTDTAEDEWDRVMAINLKGAWLCAKHAIPRIRERGGGAVVNVASNAGLVGFPNAAAYCASKGGLCQLTKAMALDCAPFGIRVNAVCPGHTRSAMSEAFVRAQQSPEKFLEDFVVRQHPLGRMAEPSEIARCILFLASEAASFVTGAVLAADGGFTAR
jgi:NAD(P)-dependent dehydrogenase (short-subunit alcohol dehydrogenase family)